MLSTANNNKNLLEHPDHIIQEINKKTKRKLLTTEHTLLEDFLQTEGFLMIFIINTTKLAIQRNLKFINELKHY